MNISVRFATQQDAALIADLSRQTFHETFAAQNNKEDMDKFMNEQFTKEALMDEVVSEGNWFFIAFEGNEPLGYIRLRENNKAGNPNNIDAIEIARIYVLQSAIGKGVGKELMLQAIAVASSMDKQSIWLGVWEHNLIAIDFYTKFGFEKFGEHPFVLGNDVQTDWLMKKQL